MAAAWAAGKHLPDGVRGHWITLSLLAVLESLDVTHAAWDPSGTFDETIRDTVVASGCTSSVFESETILVSRIEKSATCLQ